MIEHTPLPWAREDVWSIVEKERRPGKLSRALIASAGGQSGLLTHEEKVANAEFVVRACNSYYILVETCEMMLRLLEGENLDEAFDGEAEILRDAITIARSRYGT